MMRKLLGAVAALVAVAVLFVAAIFAASEFGGENVYLETKGTNGGAVTTHLWIADLEGEQWLRSGVPNAGWLQRLEVDPQVRVTRRGETQDYRAVPVRDPATRDRVHALMREKYGLADRFVSLLRDGKVSVPVRLEPDDRR